MEIELRLILLVGAVFTMAFFIRQIQKNRMQIDYAIYWALFSGALVVLAAFPGIATVGARLLHIQSPANLIYLCLIFALIIKLFTTTVKVSKLNQQVTELAQHIALYEEEPKDSHDS